MREFQPCFPVLTGGNGFISHQLNGQSVEGKTHQVLVWGGWKQGEMVHLGTIHIWPGEWTEQTRRGMQQEQN